MILFFMSVLLIVGSLATILFVDSSVVHYVSVAICLVGVGMMYYYWQKLYENVRDKGKVKGDKLRGKVSDQQCQISNLQGEIKKLSDENDKLTKQIAKLRTVPALRSDFAVRDGIAVLRDYFSPEVTEKQCNAYERLFVLLERAVGMERMVQAIGKSLTADLLTHLKNADMPLPDEQRKALEARLVELALVSIDLTTGYQSSLGSQDSIALRRAMKAITDDQALSAAKEATTNVYETPKEIRVLNSVTKELGEGIYIVKDYKLNQ